jgi:hypothetical protein
MLKLKQMNINKNNTITTGATLEMTAKTHRIFTIELASPI